MKQSLYIGMVVSMQLVASLFIQLLVIRVIGVGAETDAYIAAQAVPSVLGAIIITALQSVWLPRFSVLSNDLTAWRLEQAIAQGQAALLGGGLFLLIAFSAPVWLSLLFPGFDHAQQQDALNYSYVLLMSTAFNTQSALLTVALRSRDRFIAAEVIALLGTLFSLVVLYFVLPVWGLLAAVWVTLLRSILVYITQLNLAKWPPISLRKGMLFKETWLLMRPLLFGTSIYKTSPLVDRYWASLAPSGAITILTFAQIIINSLASILTRALGLPLTPSIARLVNESEYIEVRKIYLTLIIKMSFIILFFVSIFLLMKSQIVGLLSQVASIDYETSRELWLLTILLFGHLFAAVTGAVLVSVFYALNNTRTPVVIGIVGFLFGLFLKWFLFTSYSLTGLAIATSTYFIFNIVLFLIVLESKYFRIKVR